jgi:hypothetical protein
MVKCCVLLEVLTDFLNIIQTSFGFKWLTIRMYNHIINKYTWHPELELVFSGIKAILLECGRLNFLVTSCRYRVIKNDVALHKVIGKTVIAKQKLNSRHSVCVQKTFWVSLYNGVRLIFVWLLLCCQWIYLIFHIICNHSVQKIRAVNTRRFRNPLDFTTITMYSLYNAQINKKFWK